MKSPLTNLLLAAAFACALFAQTPQQAETAARAERLMASGQYAEAAKQWEALLADLPGNPGLMRNLGIAEQLAGQNRKAIEHLEGSLAKQPDHAPAWMLLGAAYLQTGQPAKAVAPLERALQADASLSDAVKMLAQAQAAANRPEQASKVYARWADSAPNDPAAWYGLGRSYEALAQGALAELERSAPESAAMIALVASIQEGSGNPEAAKQLYVEALRRDPKFPGLHAALARIHQAQGDAAAAQAERKFEPADATTDCGFAPLVCDDLAGRSQHALAHAAKLAAPAPLYWQARAYDKLAAEAFAKLTALPPSAEGHMLLAGMERDRGRFNESIAHWRSALALRPGDPMIEKDLAATLHQNRDYEAALPLVEELLRRAPGSPELNYLYGHILLSMRRAPESIAPLEKAAASAPSFLPARSALGLAYVQIGESAKAAPHLEAALPIDRDGSLHFRLGRVYQSLGRGEEARQMLAKSQQLRSAAGPEAQ
ncbi:MAG: tetratricopeptide repeat protein [Acidobacteria bacterium]|nr:tetratricopeptide repeat protein [Acidobacteriota bacterium]